MQKEVIWGLSLIKSSGYRCKILKAIGNNVITPIEISKAIKIRLNHVSMYLKELKEAGLVKCLNEENKKGRLYTLTKLGKEVLERYEQNTAK
ncbi:MAG: transcriptional regulator [Thermoplasmata archaeon]|nr:MAG: transcriptional regulator [Thermoplasmata archaeon]